jgi:hypothetical protein
VYAGAGIHPKKVKKEEARTKEARKEKERTSG